METRIGRQTPTQSVVLPYKKTKGQEAIKLYKLVKVGQYKTTCRT